MESPTFSSNTILNKLKSMTRNVIAIKKLEKNIEAYNVEGNSERNILCLTEFDNKAHIKVSNKWAKILKMKPHIMDALVELTEESNKNVEELDGDQENNANPIVSMNQDVHLPKMFAPFRDKKRGWNDQNVKEQLVLYFNILGYGHGGKCLINTKIKRAEKPDFFTDNVNFHNYGHPSRASMKVNEDVLEGILNFFGYNIETHCEYPPLIKSKSITKRKETITDGMDEIIAEREGNKQITSDTSECKEVTDTFEGMDTTYDYNGKNTKKRKCINYIDKECDEKIVPPKKKVSFQNPPLSDFERNVIQKNINERKEMEKFYGINNLAEELKKTISKKDYVKE